MCRKHPNTHVNTHTNTVTLTIENTRVHLHVHREGKTSVSREDRLSFKTAAIAARATARLKEGDTRVGSFNLGSVGRAYLSLPAMQSFVDNEVQQRDSKMLAALAETFGTATLHLGRECGSPSFIAFATTSQSMMHILAYIHA